MNRRPIFDAVRAMLGRGFTADEIDALDAACDTAEGAIAGRKASVKVMRATGQAGRVLGEKGMSLIQSFEGCEKDRADGQFEAYPDPGSSDGRPWTIGWGSTGRDIVPGTVWTRQQCDDRFARDMQGYANAVIAAIGDAPTTQNQFDALVSFHYNTGAIAKATLTRKHKAGDYAGAEAEFGKWVKNAGTVMRGLVRRRAAEAKLYATP